MVYLLYIVPEFQDNQGNMSSYYGGYHITVFPSTAIEDDGYSIRNIVDSLPPMQFANLCKSKDTKFIYTRDYFMMTLVNKNIETLMNVFKEKDPRWDSAIPTSDQHLTLRLISDVEGPDPKTLFRTFFDEPQWYLQLVRKVPTKDGFKYIWVEKEKYKL